MPSLNDLPGDLRRAAQAVREAGNSAALQVAKATEAEARRLSSGTATKADLRKADHPFAKRHGSPVWDPSTINAHSGDFRAHWLIEPNPRPSGLIDYVVRNDSKVAEWLEKGTPTMFARPLEDILERYTADAWAKTAPPLIQAALRNSLSK